MTHTYADLNKKQFWSNVEAIYRARMGSFIQIARSHLYNRDYAIDAVQDAFTKAVEYFNKNPGRKVRERVMRWLILKACKKINRHSKEISFGTAEDVHSEGE